MRIPIKPLNEYPFFLKPFFWSQQRKYGAVLEPGLLWGRVPQLFSAVAILFGVLDRKSSPLDPVIKSLVTVRVSQINWCEFCVDINSSVLIKRSGSKQKVEHLKTWRVSTIYSGKERAVLEYVEAMTYTDKQVTNEQMNDLKHYFDDDAIVELTGLIAFQNMSSKFNSALDVPAQGFCEAKYL